MLLMQPPYLSEGSIYGLLDVLIVKLANAIVQIFGLGVAVVYNYNWVVQLNAFDSSFLAFTLC